MTETTIRVVYDCVVFLQGAGRRTGPARECLDLVDDDTVELYLSPDLLAEIDDVLRRPEILQKFPALTSTDSQILLRAARNRAVLLTNVANMFALPRDPDDEPYTDLAIAADAHFLVTWNDRHLTYLMRQETPDGIEFCRRFPNLRIVDPVEFLAEIRRTKATN